MGEERDGTGDPAADVAVTVLRGTLPDRDAALADLDDSFHAEASLADYLESARLKRAAQTGDYRSTQGANVTPLPCWAVAFETDRRSVGADDVCAPRRPDDTYRLATAARARDLPGPGTAKERWRGTTLSGDCAPAHLYGVVTSTYLVPFAIAHRYLAHLPATPTGRDPGATLSVHHEYADRGSDRPGDGVDAADRAAIREWTAAAQRLWEERRTSGAPDLVTERLDDYGKLSRQQPRATRVVHTRSRKLYAAVLDPRGETALGLPLGKARLHTRVGDAVGRTETVPTRGVVCDNKLHYLTTGSEGEAYWLVGLLNSDPFEERVMAHASGDPPNIYSLPAKLLGEWGLTYDPDDERHAAIADLAVELETAMTATVRAYLGDEKEVDLADVDDTDAGAEVPRTVTTPYTNRFDEAERLDRLDELVASLLDEAA
jgi:hypothetical protein